MKQMLIEFIGWLMNEIGFTAGYGVEGEKLRRLPS